MQEQNGSKERGFRSLEIYRMGHELAVKVHKMASGLPSNENYEEASQVRRSSKRVPAGIVEGYAQRKYRDEFLHYLYRSLGSSDETLEHLQLLFDTGSLKDMKLFNELKSAYEILSRKIARFIMGVEREHTLLTYIRSKIQNPKSTI